MTAAFLWEHAEPAACRLSGPSALSGQEQMASIFSGIDLYAGLRAGAAVRRRESGLAAGGSLAGGGAGPVAARGRAGAAPKVLVFDSGVGGLSVQREIATRLPGARFCYVADDAGFPYGAWAEDALTARVVEIITGLCAREKPDAVVIACNTASTLVLPALRAALEVPVVGTVPAIKPAVAATRSGLVSVLATPGTVARDYTRALINTHGHGAEVTLVGSARLAGLAEARLRGEAPDEAEMRAEMAPAFVMHRDGRRTDVVVLACTHYPFLADMFVRLAPWPVHWIDPAPAIARRVADVLQLAPDAPAFRAPENDAGPRGEVIFTSGRAASGALAAVLSALRLAPAAA